MNSPKIRCAVAGWGRIAANHLAFTSDPALAQTMRELREHGQQARYAHSRIGLGARMDTLQCAVVLAKLGRFDWEIAQRQIVAARYVELLQQAGLGGSVLAVRPGRTSAYAQFTVRIAHRQQVVQALRDQGIPTAVHYPTPIHRQEACRQDHAADDCPEADLAAAEVLSLPMHADLALADQRRIVDALERALQQASTAPAPAHAA